MEGTCFVAEEELFRHMPWAAVYQKRLMRFIRLSAQPHFDSDNLPAPPFFRLPGRQRSRLGPVLGPNAVLRGAKPSCSVKGKALVISSLDYFINQQKGLRTHSEGRCLRNTPK